MGGSYTVLSQVATELLGLPLDKVKMEFGDSDFPATPGSGGLWGAASAGAGLFDACNAVRQALARKLGVTTASATFTDRALAAVASHDGLGCSGTSAAPNPSHSDCPTRRAWCC